MNIEMLYHHYLQLTNEVNAAATLTLAAVNAGQQIPADPDVLSIKEAARRASVSVRTIHRAIRDGKLISGKVGRLVRIKPRDLKKYLEAEGTALR